MASDEPSLTADQETTNDLENIRLENSANGSADDDDDNEDELEGGEEEAGASSADDPMSPVGLKLAPLNITFFNLNTLYLLFKTDLTSSYSILNNFKSIRFNNKPAGISIKYK